LSRKSMHMSNLMARELDLIEQFRDLTLLENLLLATDLETEIFRSL
jgi:hypothetical protein